MCEREFSYAGGRVVWGKKIPHSSVDDEEECQRVSVAKLSAADCDPRQLCFLPGSLVSPPSPSATIDLPPPAESERQDRHVRD